MTKELFKELCKVGKRESEEEFIKKYLLELGLAVELRTELFIPSLVSDVNEGSLININTITKQLVLGECGRIPVRT